MIVDTFKILVGAPGFVNITPPLPAVEAIDEPTAFTAVISAQTLAPHGRL